MMDTVVKHVELRHDEEGALYRYTGDLNGSHVVIPKDLAWKMISVWLKRGQLDEEPALGGDPAQMDLDIGGLDDT